MAFSHTAVRLCEKEAAAPQEKFLLRILKSEIANREEVRRARFLREGAFPVYKTLEGFDFTSPKLLPSLSREELCSAAFIPEKKNLMLYGPGQLRTKECHPHDQSRVLQVGSDLYRRPDGRGDDRPSRACT